MIVSQLSQRLKSLSFVKIPFRCKHKQDHWSVIRKKKTSSGRALEHFDDFYNSVYGKSWPDVRAALLVEKSKHMALVNNFSDTERICETLENTGAIDLRALYNAQRRLLRSEERRRAENRKLSNLDKKPREFTAPDQQFDSQTSSEQQRPEDSEAESDEDETSSRVEQPTELFSLADSRSLTDLNSDRIVQPTNDLSHNLLHQYIPATKLKGMEDYMLESEHYDYYKRGADLKISVEKQRKLRFPEHLKIYTYEVDNDTRFSQPRKGSTGVLDYYLLDGGSILPVLALDLQPNDEVLDMCAAPGGKALVALQTFMPGLLVANDIKLSRTNRIQQVLNEYVDGMGKWEDRLLITQNDARFITEQDMFNKILVDVPCTTDRHSLHEDDNNIFKPTRIKERLQLPEMQAELLLNALKIVRPGGTVVYSTCSLSPIQNDGVVQMALKKSWEETTSDFVVKNMSPCLQPLKYVFNISRLGLKYGQVVLPSLSNNFGPMYFCKLIKIR